MIGRFSGRGYFERAALARISVAGPLSAGKSDKRSCDVESDEASGILAESSAACRRSSPVPALEASLFESGDEVPHVAGQKNGGAEVLHVEIWRYSLPREFLS